MASADNVSELRQKFLDKYSGNILDDTYDDADVKWVKRDDVFLGNVLACARTKGDIKKGVELLNEILLWRAKMGLSAMKESDLSAEVVALNGLNWHGTDKDGHRILQFRVKQQKKGHLVKESQRNIAYHMNQHYQANPGQQLVLLFDFCDAGVSNMDMDMSKFTISCGSMYFPKIAAYNLMFKMGTALEAIWKLLKVFLDAEQSKVTYFVKRSNIQDYIPQDQLLPHQMKEEKKK